MIPMQTFLLSERLRKIWNVWPQGIHHIFHLEDLWGQRLSCLGWSVVWGNEFFFFCWSCGNMWLAREGGWRLHVIGQFSDGLCSLVSWNFWFQFTRQCFNGCLLCGDRTHICSRCFGKKGSQHSCLETQSKEANICASIMEIQTNKYIYNAKWR